MVYEKPMIIGSDLEHYAKACYTCGVVKPAADFHKKSKERDGLNNTCKACVNAAYRSFYIDNKEELKARRRRQHAKN